MVDRRHADIMVTHRLWEQICQELISRWEDLDVQAQNQECERIVKRWRSIRDRFKKKFNKDAGPEWIWRTQEQIQVCLSPVVPQVNDGDTKHRREPAAQLNPFCGDPSGGRHRGTLWEGAEGSSLSHIGSLCPIHERLSILAGSIACICWYKGRKCTAKSKHRECGECGDLLPDAYEKKLCRPCIQRLIEEEAPDLTSTLKDMVRREVRGSIKSLSQKEDSKKGKKLSSPVSEIESDSAELTSDSSQSSSSSIDVESGYSCLPLEKVNRLVKAVNNTMGIEEPQSEWSMQDNV
ncbi:uncharacterized protein LOC143808960 [Ranitomeya variabilis]|uniref:uncharacterized protein LOC143808960 n=1 Tax=Ranitomeya variabilis TaxID=490064 RepID=UPI004056DC47